MGMLPPNRLAFKHKEIQASMPKEKDSLCQENDRSQDGERYSETNLPEDIWCHIHSLMPMRDSARSACVSRTFMRSWKCYPKLIFTEYALGLKQNACQESDIAKAFTSRVDHILKSHAGVAVKTLKLVIYSRYNVDNCRVTCWLQNAITPGIEEIALFLATNYKEEYNFPCSILLNGCGNSIRYLNLSYCALRPTVGFDCLRSLTKLHLSEVRITGDELGCLISRSSALEHLELWFCRELICLKIPFWLERLSSLLFSWCKMLQVIESAAPNLSSFVLLGDPVRLSLGESSQVMELHLGLSHQDNLVSYSLTRLPSIVPHLKTLFIDSIRESIDTPMVANRFLHLKYLKIFLEIDYVSFSPTYVYLALVSFLDASPALETFILCVNHEDEMKHVSVYGDVSHMRQIHGHKHQKLKEVQINGFCSAKSMVELACHILDNATSLESLTVDTIWSVVVGGDFSRCSDKTSGECSPVRRDRILEAHRTHSVVRGYILGKVPSTVKFNVGEPCSWCHALDVKVL